MRYVNVEIRIGGEIDEHHLDILSGALFELGALGIETRDATEPLTLVASFPAEAEPEPQAEPEPAVIEGEGDETREASAEPPPARCSCHGLPVSG